jgi:hypothetical protein
MIFKTLLIRKARRLPLALVAMAALASCKKDASAPTGFGVNVTINARALSAADRARVTNGDLLVVVGTTPAPKINLSDKVHEAILSGELRFHYTPETGVLAGQTLTLGFDALDASKKIISSGSADPVVLKATAVSVTITLPANNGDGGMTGDGANGKGNGTACVAGPECSSGFCADGVCCNEKCDDVCVSCKLAATKGMCTPHAVDTDPDMDCRAKLPPMAEPDDAGTSTSDATTGDGAGPSGDAAAGGSDAAAEVAESDAAVINTPDGGLMSMPNACAGACSGARSCKFPDKTKSCGTPFCNTRKEVASFVCDGNGGCNVELSSCSTYACEDGKGSCGTQCSGHTDCLLGFYCNANSQCVAKKVIGIGCTPGAVGDPECKSDHCSGGVCCNTACEGMGLSCNDTGSLGQCKCQGVTCAAGVACQVFYKDADVDGFGNRDGTIAAGTAKAGCMGAPPTGFVADKTDCDDGDANVHPGQTAFFGTPSLGTPHTFDYNCDGNKEKQTPEYPGGSCRFCGAVGTCDQTTTTCMSAGQTASFICTQEAVEIIRAALPLGSDLQSLADPGGGPAGLSLPAGTAAAAPGAPAAAPGVILPPPICKFCFQQCCGCHAADKAGFITVGGVACGAVDTVYTCGACAAAGGGAAAPARTLTRQFCR